ncbi:MAG: single-stranded DNA-binding protein [Eggerthellaceae bacterium]|nr:single-stranded DNA-binding protein [Eggerthellaceae bacterium]MBQ3342693.1 single-stranded DNA-binding protein [Kiritimatiellia bacterium]
MSINSVNISGNLTRDCAEFSTSNYGGINFTVCVETRKKDQSGEWVSVPNYIDCVMYGKRADYFKTRLLKGSKVAVQGRLRYEEWDADDGRKRSKIRVICDEIETFSGQKQARVSDGYESDDVPF